MHKLIENFSVLSDPNKQIANKGEILIGLGNTQIDNKGLVFQHKTSKKQYLSLSQYVYKLKIKNKIQDYHTLFIEDLSVDTLLSIWITLNKMSQHQLPKTINLWLDYVSRWESGDTSTTGKPFNSYGCLQNALLLNHQNITVKELLSSSLYFLGYLIEHSINPANIPEISNFDLYSMAKNNLFIEHKKYNTIVKNSEILVLNIPKINSENNVKISGIFIEIDIISSIQKVFLRNDNDSPTKDGYALIAIYNSSMKGTGNDIVISVDPVKQIHLKALWKALEKEEDTLWEGNRPKDDPRPLKSYKKNDGPNEPWWDDMGRYTLIAAPKMVGSKNGRRVSWKYVKKLIKQLYSKGI